MVKVTAAANASQGALQVFKIGRAADALVDISVYSSGLASVGLERTGSSRVIPGAGLQKASQQLGAITPSLPFECDKNDLTRPVLQELGADDLYFEYGPEGEISGGAKYTGYGPCPLQRPSPAGETAGYSGTIRPTELERGTY